MRPVELLILYLLIGGGVALAMSRAGRPGAAMAVLFWPVFVPALAEGGRSERPAADGTWEARIRASVQRLREALGAWEGLPAAAAQLESATALGRRLEGLAERLGALEAVIAAPEHAPETLAAALAVASAATRPLVAARAENVARLIELRDRTRGDLEQTLAILDELAVRAAVARFTGDAVESLAAELRSLTLAVDAGHELAGVGRAGVMGSREIS